MKKENYYAQDQWSYPFMCKFHEFNNPYVCLCSSIHIQLATIYSSREIHSHLVILTPLKPKLCASLILSQKNANEENVLWNSQQLTWMYQGNFNHKY